jgi:hypothetical protein
MLLTTITAVAVLLPGALLAQSTPYAEIVLSVSHLAAHPSEYDRQHVGVTGKVENIQLKTSQRGNAYEVFKVCDKVCVRVFTWGHPKLSEGQSKTVHGTFAAVKHVGADTFYNEIEADETWRTQCC